MSILHWSVPIPHLIPDKGFEIMPGSFKPAGVAEVLRSAQKDDAYAGQLARDLSDLFLGVVGPRAWIQWQPWIESSGHFLYHSLTTMFNYQTLGEEYCGIVQVGILSTKNKMGSTILFSLSNYL